MVVMNVIDFVVNKFLLGARMAAESEAFKPGMSQSMMSAKVMASYIVMDLVLGILLVWTYAAIRPRFGPGVKTAVYAAFLFWILAAIFLSGYLHWEWSTDSGQSRLRNVNFLISRGGARLEKGTQSRIRARSNPCPVRPSYGKAFLLSVRQSGVTPAGRLVRWSVSPLRSWSAWWARASGYTTDARSPGIISRRQRKNKKRRARLSAPFSFDTCLSDQTDC